MDAKDRALAIANVLARLAYGAEAYASPTFLVMVGPERWRAFIGVYRGKGEQSGHIVHFDVPAIRTHSFDGVYWTATLLAYDGPPDPCGSGRTEAEAVADLIEQLGREAGRTDG